MSRSFRTFIAVALLPLTALTAQQPTRLTRSAAIAAATTQGPRLSLARADTTLAAAQLMSARAFPNPTISAGYTRDIPRYHVTAELPFDFLTTRGTRVRSAQASQLAAKYRFAFDKALLVLDADTTYTRALAAQARVQLSRRNAEAADSLRRIAVARRNAGDASDLDVELATINAGQQANIASADSITLTAALLDLQVILGMPADRVMVEMSDSLEAPTGPVTTAAAPGRAGGPVGRVSPDSSLPVASAAASVEAADLALRAERRSVLMLPGLLIGFDTGDPTGDTHGLLPTVGISLPLPFFNRNKGPIAVAEAERERASAELAIAQVATRAAIARASREESGAMARLGRDAVLVASANRVATMSLAAYREGAAPLSSVLEAQRNAREVLGQYIDDVAAALVAGATLRALTLTTTSGTLP